MKSTIVLLIMATTLFTACSSSGGGSKNTQADPRAVAETIFDAAKSGKYETLPALIDADADGDSKRIAQVATDKTLQEDFQKYFSKGKVSADPVIEGEKASVNILFGPEGNNEETLEMVRKDGKWYLVSF